MQTKKGKLIAAAISLFHERGFWDTPTALIAKRAGVANGTLFNHFPSKAALIKAVHLSLKRDWSKHIEHAALPGGTIRAQLEECWRRAIEWPVAHPRAFALLEQLKLSEDLENNAAIGDLGLFAETYALIDQAMDTGQFRPIPVDLIHNAAFAQVCVAVSHIHNYPDAQLDDISSTSFDMFWRSIAANQTATPLSPSETP
jgi:AcrR family transcriptional regulator